MKLVDWAKAEVLHLAWKRGRYTPPDRALLEREILPGLAAEDGHDRVLSVGVAWYTARYSEAFAGKNFTTLDSDSLRKTFGAAQHLVGDLCDLERLVDAAAPFDVLLMNGVIGYGLNAPADVDRALRACAARMRSGGTLLIGVNEEKPTHVAPSSVSASALFEPRPFGRWKDGRIVVEIPFKERTHTFLFWRRR